MLLVPQCSTRPTTPCAVCRLQNVLLPDAFPLSAHHVARPWSPRASPPCCVVYGQTSIIRHGLTAVEVFILYAQITGLLGFQSHFLSCSAVAAKKTWCCITCKRLRCRREPARGFARNIEIYLRTKSHKTVRILSDYHFTMCTCALALYSCY